MANNQEQNKDFDPEYEKTLKSMGNRIDSDSNPVEDKDKKPEEKENPPANPNPEANPKPEEKKDIAPENPNPDADPDKDPVNKKPVNRGERFIPMGQYHDEKREHKQEIDILNKKIEDLTILANQKDTPKKDDEIEAFMTKTGFDRETVEGLLELAEKRVLTPELKDAIKKAETIVKEADIETEFAIEFENDGEPALKTYFPTIDSEKVAKAKTFLNQIAHTAEYHDKTFDYIIFKNKGELEKLFGEGGDPSPVIPQDKKTIEPNRMGQGKPTGLTAKEFVNQKDFSALNDMDQSARNELIKSFDDKTYDNFASWVASQNNGVEVMRNGQKITLK